MYINMEHKIFYPSTGKRLMRVLAGRAAFGQFLAEHLDAGAHLAHHRELIRGNVGRTAEGRRKRLR